MTTRERMRRFRRRYLKSRSNRALRIYLISKARLGIWDKRYCAYYGVDPNVDAGVRRFITRGYAAGLVATSTTGGQHAPGSWHYQKLLGKGRAADMGVRKELLGTPEQWKRLNAFHAAEWKRRGRTHPIELIGPANNLIVLKGSDTALAEGTALEQAHDNHVHFAA